MYSLKYQMILVDTWPSTSSYAFALHRTGKENWEMYCLWKTALVFWHSGLHFAHYFCFIELREIQELFFETFYQWQCQWLPEELVRGALYCHLDPEFSAFHNIVFENFDLSLVIVWMKSSSPSTTLFSRNFRRTPKVHWNSFGQNILESLKGWKKKRAADLCERSAIKEQYTVGFLFLSQNPRPKKKQGTQTFFKEQSLILRVREASWL